MTVDAAPPPTEQQPAVPSIAPEVAVADRLSTATAADRPQAPAVQVALAAGLAMAGSAFMVGGLFGGVFARIVGVLAVALGCGIVTLSARSNRPGVQYAVVPLSLVAGALLVVREATGQGSSSLPALVAEALHEGGISHPPIPFDPGWRFLIVVLFVLLGAGATGVGIALNRPKLGVFVALPLAMVGELVQPAGQEVVATLGTAVLMIMGLAVAFGAELRAAGVQTSGRFERRRLTRTLGLLLVLAVATSMLPRLTFLFPVSDRPPVVPPQRPQVPPTPPDQPLLRYHIAGGLAPLRLGVLDVYDLDQQAWLLPSIDPARITDMASGNVPGADTHGLEEYTVEVRIENQTGHVLPTIGGLQHVAIDQSTTIDSETQIVQTPDHLLSNGLDYSAVGLRPPAPSALQQLGPSPKELTPFLVAPAMPQAVQKLLATAPADPYDRLQVLRNALYQKVVAAGQGLPNADMPASKVVDELNGHEATPYEITAAEALLARWAGVPSRVGFGYYQGTQQGDGWYEVRPKDGSTWLEVYFQDYGWLPIVGVPQQARSSLDSANQNQSSSIHATNDIHLVLHVPVRVTSAFQYFDFVRYWLLLALPWLALSVAVWFLIPFVAKLLRSRRRRRWATHHGPHARILAAYAAFRDVCVDLMLPMTTVTPLEFLDAVDPDDEHAELAWLATRAIWGDLLRGVDEHDCSRAQELARSVTRRVLRAQPALTVALAGVSRASLREPYTRVIPNLWWAPRTSRRIPALQLRRFKRRLRTLRLRLRARRSS